MKKTEMIKKLKKAIKVHNETADLFLSIDNPETRQEAAMSANHHRGKAQAYTAILYSLDGDDFFLNMDSY